MAGSYLWLWDNESEEWIKAPAAVTTKRMTAAGQVIAGAHKLYWLHENPSAGSGLYELSDDLDGASDIVFDHFSTTREGHMVRFDPPIPFSTGIYLKTYTSLTSLVFGYV